ncbi:hypothetical protein BDP27DRAFT_238759 [Rhodocollybia butyracea]|uniref:Uncharacterized protein n=1 Tax=Rhodocollybia butyracea TaxID=206335 RepID=A0A9P5PDX2_9AGAR|nr:hypothetical protein BDP27DRAFT_238759 [Rhodocollybia butyracea]
MFFVHNAELGLNIPLELWNQIIASMRNHLTTGRACTDDIYSLLEIFGSCWPPSSPALQQHAFLLLDDFRNWIERTTPNDLLLARVSETICSLTRIIHYIVHYFVTDLVSSSRFAGFAKFVDDCTITLDIDTQSLRTGRSTWQEAKRTLITRSNLPLDYFSLIPTFVYPIHSDSSSSSTFSSESNSFR